MPYRARRPIALLLGLLFAHLTWANDASPCTSALSATAAIMAGMATGGVEGQAMDAMHMARASTESVASSAHDADRVPTSDSGCPRPSPLQCQSMAPCAPMMLTVGPEFSTVATQVETPRLRLMVLTPPSRSLAPESPPPKA